MDLQTAQLSSPAAAELDALAEPEWITRATELGWAWPSRNWQRAASVDCAWFDARKADLIVAQWPKIIRLTTKRFAGKPFKLAFWEEIIVRMLFGWKRPVEIVDEDSGQPVTLHVRLFQELRLWIPRKNGKSEFLAGLALVLWAIEGEVRGQGFCFAHDENQAREVFDKIADMAGYAPAHIAQEIRILSKTLWIQSLKSAFRLLSGKEKGKHGRAPTVTVGDEMHEWKSRGVADTLRQGEGASLQPVRLYASTAGLKTQFVGRGLWDESEAILDGRIIDPTTLVAIFAAGEDDDWRNEAVWAKANPSLGLSPTITFLRGEYAKAQTPAGEAAFRRYHLNQWVEDISRWIPLKIWDQCQAAGKPNWRELPDELAGRECTIAFDSTKSFDLASICLRFPPVAKGERTKFIWKCWLPSETIARRVENERVPFDRWRDQGALIEIPGEVFVLKHAIDAVKQACGKYKVTRIGYDAWNALEFYNQLVDGGLPEDLFVEMRFGTKTLGGGTREFERKVFGQELEHGGNPLVRWMIGHCHVRFDENMNFVPAKKKSELSIDAVVAAVMTEALASTPVEKPPPLKMLFV